jgi:dTDP-4-dehydrorhamnose 3,5-epimerase
MIVDQTELGGVLLITPSRHGDSRGFFSEVFRADLFEAAAGPVRFVQDNHSRSARAGTLRGLHFQREPRAQGKLVRVTRGAVIDVVVDVREGSPSYGRHIAVELSEENWRQLWIPVGFLHGFATLTDDVEFLYKVTDHYSAEHDAAVAWDDPTLAVAWPAPPAGGWSISDKDRKAPRLAELSPLFRYRGP